ncbi:MAG: conjugated bile salt MFS transporter [Sarcina sp.]
MKLAKLTTTHKNLKLIIGCMLIQAIPFSIASNIQPQFVSYVIKGCHFSLIDFSFIFTIGTLISAIVSPFIGTLYSKISFKFLFIFGCLLSGLGFLSFGFAKTLYQFYIIAGIVQIGTLIFSAIGIPTLINKYFGESNKGTVLSLAFAGGSIGNIVLQELVVYLLNTKGFRFTYIIFGITSVLASVLFTTTLLDFKKLNKSTLSIEENPKDKISKTKSALFSLIKNKTFIFFSIGFIFMGFAMAALSIQYPNYLKNLMNHLSIYKNISFSFLGTIGSLFAIFSLIGNLLGGVLFDKLGVKKTLSIAFLLTVISDLALILAIFSPIFAYIFAITKGLSVYSYMMGPSYLSNYFFKGENFSQILSIINFMFAIGFSAGSILFATISSNLGFINGWLVILIFIVISFVTLLLANSKRKRLK